jgi:GH25 family lysozyme M1 (1,4-beta-N-acetylmuramidase)
MAVYGWDASHYDWDRRTLNLAEARHAGISLMTHKATEGTTYTDPRLDDWATQAKTAGFPVAGTYHVLWPNNIADQVDHWVSQVTAKVPWWRDHPCFIWQIDCEIFQGMPRSPNLSEINAFGDMVVARTGSKPSQVVTYAPNWLYGDTLKGLRYRLWSSTYVGSGSYKSVYPGDDGKGWRPYSGQTPLIWQYSSTTIIGHQLTCDANAIRVASEPALQALFTNQPVGEDMPLTTDEIASIAEAVWATGVKNPDSGLVQSAAVRLVGAQAQTDLDKAVAAVLAQAKANGTGLTELAAKLVDLAAEVAALQPGGPVGGPAAVTLTGTITPS